MKTLVSPDIESAVLGSFIVEKAVIPNIDALSENNFSIEINKVIFKAIQNLYSQNKEIDLPSLYEEIKRDKDVDISYLTSTVTASQPFSIKQHIEILKEKTQRRNLYKLLQDSLSQIQDPSQDIEGLKATVASKIDNLSESKNYSDDSSSIVMRLFEDLEKRLDEEEMDKYLYGIPELDNLTAGVHKEELITIAAKSSKGKTAFLLQILTRLASKGLKVLLFSREMSDTQMFKRIIASLTGISGAKLRKKDFNEIEWEEIIKALNVINKMQIHCNTDCSTIAQIKARIRQVKPDIVAVDYLQLLTPDNSNETREQQVAKLSREMKNITMDFKIPVIQLSQLNDDMKDARPYGDRPMRESKAIFHDSNVVIYLHEPNGKELEEIFNDSNNSITPAVYKAIKDQGNKIIEVILAKQRDGQLGRFLQMYVSERLQFRSLKRQ